MVNTVTGPIGLDRLGRTLMHEHLLVSYPGAELDPSLDFDRPAFVRKAVGRLRALKEHGVTTFVDPCPIELGRDPVLMREIAEKAEMQVVCTTGFYSEDAGIPHYWRYRTVEEIAQLYVSEIERGIGKTGIKAGAIKCATSSMPVTALEERVFAAACMAQNATGVPIITHTQDGAGGPEQQALFARGGVAAHSCLIGHCCGSADPAYHRRIVDGGSFIGFDRIGIPQFQPDTVRADNLVKLVRDGFAHRVIMSQDRPCHVHGKFQRPVPGQDRLFELQRKGEWPGPQTYLFTDFLPLLRARGLSDAEIFPILDDNPRRLFAGQG